MATVTIALSDEQMALAKAQATERGFARLELYLQSLVSEQLRGDDVEEDCGAPKHLRVSSLEQMKTLVEEGLRSPAREMTHEDFQQMRQAVVDRHNASKAD